MSLPKQVVEDVLYLHTHSKHFQRLMGHWKKGAGMVVTDILSPMTDANEREVLVRFYEMFNREVIDLPVQAYNESVKE